MRTPNGTGPRWLVMVGAPPAEAPPRTTLRAALAALPAPSSAFPDADAETTTMKAGRPAPRRNR